MGVSGGDLGPSRPWRLGVGSRRVVEETFLSPGWSPVPLRVGISVLHSFTTMGHDRTHAFSSARRQNDPPPLITFIVEDLP